MNPTPATTDPEAPAASIVLVEDRPLMRKAERDLLTDHGYVVVGEAADGETAVPLVTRLTPDIVLLDIELEGEMDGLDVAEVLAKKVPSSKVMLFSGHVSPALVRRAIGVGAAAYFETGASAAELVRAVEHVRAGGKYFSPSVQAHIDKIVKGQVTFGARRDPTEPTPRECEVMDLIAYSDMTNAEVAARLGISLKTVNKQVGNVRDKLGSPRWSRPHLIRAWKQYRASASS